MGLWDSIKRQKFNPWASPMGTAEGHKDLLSGDTGGAWRGAKAAVGGPIYNWALKGTKLDTAGQGPSLKRQQKDMLKADMATLQNDPNALGLTDAEREKMIAEATGQANAQQNAAISQLGQSALAGQGFQQGAFSEAAQAIPDQGSEAAAKAAVGVNQLHRQMIDSEKDRIRGEIEATRMRRAESAKYWAQFGIDANTSLTESASSMMEAMPAAAMASTRASKTDIAYENEEGLKYLHSMVMEAPLASWKYRDGDDTTHIGIIIDDDLNHPAITSDHSRVDLYTYASMAHAALKVQQRQIDVLVAEVQALKAAQR